MAFRNVDVTLYDKKCYIKFDVSKMSGKTAATDTVLTIGAQ